MTEKPRNVTIYKDKENKTTKNKLFFDERNMKESEDEWAWTLQWNLRGDRRNLSNDGKKVLFWCFDDFFVGLMMSFFRDGNVLEIWYWRRNLDKRNILLIDHKLPP